LSRSEDGEPHSLRPSRIAIVFTLELLAILNKATINPTRRVPRLNEFITISDILDHILERGGRRVYTLESREEAKIVLSPPVSEVIRRELPLHIQDDMPVVTLMTSVLANYTLIMQNDYILRFRNPVANLMKKSRQDLTRVDTSLKSFVRFSQSPPVPISVTLCSGNFDTSKSTEKIARDPMSATQRSEVLGEVFRRRIRA
jgi:hypothetical protein